MHSPDDVGQNIANIQLKESFNYISGNGLRNTNTNYSGC